MRKTWKEERNKTHKKKKDVSQNSKLTTNTWRTEHPDSKGAVSDGATGATGGDGLMWISPTDQPQPDSRDVYRSRISTEERGMKKSEKINQAITKGDSVICVYYYYRADTFCMQPYNTLSSIFRFSALRCGFLFLTLAEKGKISKYHSGVETSWGQRAKFTGFCCFIVYHYSQDDLPAGEAGFF